jgi:hypothetical protein
MEVRLAQYAKYYYMNDLKIDMNQDEIMELNFNNHKDLLPFDDRLVQMHEQLALHTYKWDHNPMLHNSPSMQRPLSFYGGYVTLSSMDREAIGSSSINDYYKCVI